MNDLDEDGIANAYEIIKSFIGGMVYEFDEESESIKKLKKLKFVPMEVLEDCLCEDCINEVKGIYKQKG